MLFGLMSIGESVLCWPSLSDFTMALKSLTWCASHKKNVACVHVCVHYNVFVQ